MKNQKFMLFVIFTLFFSCEPTKNLFKNPTSFKDYPKLDFNPNQGIVIFDSEPTDVFRKDFLKYFSPGSSFESLKIRKCHPCDTTYMELWEGENIGTDIHARALTAGSGVKSDAVGEAYKAVAYINIESSIPPDFSNKITYTDTIPSKKTQNTTLVNNVIVAVIDTGIDLEGTFSNKNHVWHNTNLTLDGSSAPCHSDGLHGWNFLDQDDNIQDDHGDHNFKIHHGTKVSQLIVSQIDDSSVNNINIMTLKTHDKNGKGDLFSNICAIHYAMDHGAHIINASWGFYLDKPSFKDSYLIKLITEKLEEKGILFVTAAGNQIPGIRPNSADINPRDLNQFNFIPAVFGTRNNNILVATTHFNGTVSDTQNFSSRYVDFGIQANYDDFTFKPWQSANEWDKILGSSYATAILSGKIGANISIDLLRSGISKNELISHLNPYRSQELRIRRKVRNGYYFRSKIE